MDCQSLLCLPAKIGPNLEDLQIVHCVSLSVLPLWLGHLPALRCLRVIRCPAMTEIPLTNDNGVLDHLDISGCP